MKMLKLTCVYEWRMWRYILLLAICLTAFPLKTEAHEGPPFPIIIDEVVGPFLVSVWTDPDIGIGTFFVVFESASGDDMSDITSVQIAVEPASGRLDERIYSAESQYVRYGARYLAEVEFDQGEMWNVRVIMEGPGWEKELLSEVEATPDGTIGPIGLLIYALPFVAIGIIWIRAMIRRREVE